MEGLSFRYAGRRRPALRDISFDVADGETVLVLGPSGCGKSTLGLCLNGMVPHVVAGELGGSVRIHGREVRDRPLEETVRDVGIVFQDPETQLCMLRVDEEVAFGLENLSVPPGEMPARIAAALEVTGLESPGSTRTDWLSGGNKQRLALACVLAMEPSVLIFDEPTSNLDPAGAHAVFSTIARLKAAGRHTIVVIEHRLDPLMSLVDRVIVMGRDGMLLDDGEPHQVLERQARALDEFGIWKPQVAELADALREQGVVVPVYPITVAEAEDGLTGMLRPTSGERARNGEVRTFAGTPSAGAAARIRGLTAGYGRGPSVLRDVELEVRQGEVLALVGPNGAGKSTLAQHLIATLRAPRGTVLVEGRDIRDINSEELARTVGYVFQNPEHQFVAGTVFDELAFGLRVRGEAESDVRTRVEALLAEFGLSGLAAANPFKLSHGEKRRLSVATMLILKQRILVLDEPTFGQDRRHATALLQKLRALNEAGTTLIVITHDMRLVAEHASRVAVLEQGRVLACLGRDDLFDDKGLLERAQLEVPPIRALSQRLFGDRGRPLPSTVDEFVQRVTRQPVEIG